MSQQFVSNLSGTRLIAAKPVFCSTILVFILTITIVWIWGMVIHRTLFGNALISTGVLSILTASFFTVVLFKGLKLKDNLGKIVTKFKWERFSELPPVDLAGWFSIEASEGFFETVFIVIVSLITALIFVFSLWLLANLLWATTLMVVAALYRVFFRTVRLVLKSSKRCQGNWTMSLAYSMAYTFLYSSCFYTLIVGCYFLLR